MEAGSTASVGSPNFVTAMRRGRRAGGGRALVSILKNGAHEPVGADHRAWSHLSLPTERRLGVRARGSREGGRHTAGLLAPAASGGAQLRCALEISSLSVSLSVPLGAVK